MNETIVAKSVPFNIKQFLIILLIIISIIGLVSFVIAGSNSSSTIDEAYELYREHHKYYSDSWDGHWEHYDALCHYGGCEGHIMNEPKFIYTSIEANMFGKLIFVLFALVALYAIIVVFALATRSELTITDKRIYGAIGWGKRVDLPLDSISATSKVTLLRGISVSTSSGRISFLFINNFDHLYGIVSELIVQRQHNNSYNMVNIHTKNEAEQIMKFKELLDMGVITQEEFDAKKKQLLDL